MLQPAHGLHAFFISKTGGHHFWPSLMAGAEIERQAFLKFLFPKLLVTIFGLG
jgi:hypothetical protein